MLFRASLVSAATLPGGSVGLRVGGGAGVPRAAPSSARLASFERAASSVGPSGPPVSVADLFIGGGGGGGGAFRLSMKSTDGADVMTSSSVKLSVRCPIVRGAGSSGISSLHGSRIGARCFFRTAARDRGVDAGCVTAAGGGVAGAAAAGAGLGVGLGAGAADGCGATRALTGDELAAATVCASAGRPDATGGAATDGTGVAGAEMGWLAAEAALPDGALAGAPDAIGGDVVIAGSAVVEGRDGAGLDGAGGVTAGMLDCEALLLGAETCVDASGCAIMGSGCVLLSAASAAWSCATETAGAGEGTAIEAAGGIEPGPWATPGRVRSCVSSSTRSSASRSSAKTGGFGSGGFA